MDALCGHQRRALHGHEREAHQALGILVGVISLFRLIFHGLGAPRAHSYTGATYSRVHPAAGSGMS